MTNITQKIAESGRITGEDGRTYNKVSLYKAAGSGAAAAGNADVNITQMPPRSGRLIGEDNKIYNEADLIMGLGESMGTMSADISKLKDDVHEAEHELTLAGSDISRLQDIVERMSYTAVLTQAQYDALSSAQQENGTIYFTTDTRKVYKEGVEYAGGPGGAYTEDVLWENQGSTNPASITLSHSYTDYDMIVISNKDQYLFPDFMLTADLYTGKYIGYEVDVDTWISFVVASDTELTVNAGRNITLGKIYGLKFGGGTVDNAMSDSSTNPVQNRVLKAELDAIKARLAALEGAV